VEGKIFYFFFLKDTCHFLGHNLKFMHLTVYIKSILYKEIATWEASDYIHILILRIWSLSFA
jgi:hypothetical protein